MIEIKIEENDSSQRFDRFLRKYLKNAPLSLIQKNIRNKNFKINDKRAKADDIVLAGDLIKMYIKDEDFNKWKKQEKFVAKDFKIDIIYEDDNIILIDKKAGVLTHASSSKDYGNNLVDSMISYLYKTGKVNSRDKTFVPAVVNRLDRNTSGIVIGAKNAKALRILNEAIRLNKINKYYLTIVDGLITKDFTVESHISKNEKRNKVKLSSLGDKIITKFHPLENNGKFTLLECQLITGKTHQIRFSLKDNSSPIIGDRKYGNKNLNKKLLSNFGIRNQILLAYKIVFENIDGLDYLNNKIFYSNQKEEFDKIKGKLFYEFEN